MEETENKETEKMERNIEENFEIKPIYSDFKIRMMDYDAAYMAQCDITDRINEYKSIARKRSLTTKENKELEALDEELEKINRKMEEESIFIKNDRIRREQDKYEEEKRYKVRNTRYSNCNDHNNKKTMKNKINKIKFYSSDFSNCISLSLYISRKDPTVYVNFPKYILVAGGYDDENEPLNSVEVFYRENFLKLENLELDTLKGNIRVIYKFHCYIFYESTPYAIHPNNEVAIEIFNNNLKPNNPTRVKYGELLELQTANISSEEEKILILDPSNFQNRGLKPDLSAINLLLKNVRAKDMKKFQYSLKESMEKNSCYSNSNNISEPIKKKDRKKVIKNINIKNNVFSLFNITGNINKND